MTVVATVAAVLLGAAFLVAGGSKVAAGPAWPNQARELGAPALAVPILPWLEIVIGAALVVGLGEPFATIAALTLLVAFTALIGIRLAQGRRPVCACFGAWSATPIGPMHLVRNGVLIALGVLSLTA